MRREERKQRDKGGEGGGKSKSRRERRNKTPAPVSLDIDPNRRGKEELVEWGRRAEGGEAGIVWTRDQSTQRQSDDGAAPDHLTCGSLRQRIVLNLQLTIFKEEPDSVSPTSRLIQSIHIVLHTFLPCLPSASLPMCEADPRRA